MNRILLLLLIFVMSAFSRRFYDPTTGIWISIDPKRQFNNSYSYGGNNPINQIDPDGSVVYAATQYRQAYANFASKLPADQATKLYAMEQDKNVQFQFIAGTESVNIDGTIADGFALPTEEKGVVLYVNMNATEYSPQKVFVHDVVTHGSQILDLYEQGMTTSEVLDDLEKNQLDYEVDAWKAQGDPKSKEQLNDMGYNE